jgi:hypothetical protein
MDTVCLVKRFVHDAALSQPPLLVAPADRYKVIPTKLPVICKIRKTVTAKKQKSWMDLADKLSIVYGNEGRGMKAVVYLRSVANGLLHDAPPPIMPWHEAMGSSLRLPAMSSTVEGLALPPVVPLRASWVASPAVPVANAVRAKAKAGAKAGAKAKALAKAGAKAGAKAVAKAVALPAQPRPQ